MRLRGSLFLIALLAMSARADDKVMLQGFYWDCPEDWYPVLEKQAPELAAAGFTSVWLPPPGKGGHGRTSMGYDPYDHYDLGEFDQKGTTPTHFGTKQELISLVSTLHKNGVRAYADIVLNHMASGDKEWNPIASKYTRTKYNYAHTGPRIDVDYRDFHPSHVHPDQKAPYHNPIFGNDICQAEAHMGEALKQWGDWLTTTVGYDGYRLDFVKGIDPGYVKDWLSYGAMKGKFAVSEFWDGNVDAVERWINDGTARQSSAFDFPLFYKLKEMCNETKGAFDMRHLDGAGLRAKDPMRAVTFVENHDTDRSDPVRTDKMMAYAFVLTMEGQPCVFYRDYETRGLKKRIDPLISIRKKLCGGATTTLHAGHNLFVAQRNGNNKVPGAILVLNNSTQWKSVTVDVKASWAGKELQDFTGHAGIVKVSANGKADLQAPPRSYAVFSPR